MAAPIIVAAIAAFGSSSSAEAATVSIERGHDSVGTALETLHFEAGPGEANSLTATRTGPETFKFRDTGAAVTPGSGCTGGGAPGVEVTCTTFDLDNISHNFGGVSIELGDGDDMLDATGLPQPDTAPQYEPALETRIAGKSGADTILAGSADDTIDPGPGDDVVTAGEGDDIIETAPNDGADRLDGGDGVNFENRPASDWIDYASRTEPVQIVVDDLPNDGEAGEGDLLTGFERMEGGQGDDRFTGGDGHEDFGGLGGRDRIAGGAGNDFLGGGDGRDTIFGQAGADQLLGDEQADLLIGGVGRDQVSGLGGSDRLVLGSDDDFGEGGSGDDAINGQGGDDRLLGGGGDDQLRGSGGDDHVTGLRGSDRLLGGPGDDWIDAVHGLVAEVGVVGRDGSRDRVDCGVDRDAARAERDDRVRGCESVRG